jgi:two-component system sensor kinase FixL
MELAASAAELGMWMWDIVRDEIWITDKGRDLFGVHPSEKIDFDRFRNMLHPEDRESVLKALENSLRTGAQYNSEYRAVLPDGQLRWIAGRGNVEFNGEGQPIRMRGASLDITKRKQAEEHFRLAADAGGLIVWSWDIRRDEVSLSEKDRAFLGFSREEKLNAERVRSVVHPEDRKLVRRLVEKSLHTCEETEAEYRVVLPDGEVRWVTRRGRVEFDGNGEPIWERGVLMDITERKQAELEAARHRHELTHLSRVTMLGELSGSLAHELNQPLAAILSNAQAAQQFLKEDVFDVNELRQVLAEIVAEDKRAGEVIRHVRLLFRKGEVGQHFGNLDINEVVQDVLKLMRNDLANQGVTVQTELAENLPAVQGDRVQLQQVLLNLMLNGCEAMIDRDPSECQLLITSGMENSAVHVSVRDRGGSIPEETMERVFEPFFTTKADGMGLGLSVCRTIIEAHRGNISVRNNADGGATFHFSLPARSQAQKKIVLNH